MEVVKSELEAVREVLVNSEEIMKELVNLQLVLVGGGSTDVQFC
jgi:hypothetical protein